MVSETVLDVLLSILMLLLALVLSEILRPGLRRVVPQRHQYLAMEAIFTLQLCLLMQELTLLTEAAGLPFLVSLPLLYATVVLHFWSARCAQCNPDTSMQQLLTGNCTVPKTLLKIQFQLVAAFLAWLVASQFHRLGLTRIHSTAAEECASHLQTDVVIGTLVEFTCAFVFHSLLYYNTEALYRVHALGAMYVIIFASVGHLTGAMFNPALAFSINFFCKGSSLLDNIFVYWLGPIAGMILSVMLFDQVLPTVRRMIRRDDVSFEKMD